MLFKMINVSAERGDWMGVQSNVHRLRNSQSKPEDLLKNQPKILAALGLSQMHAKSFRDAATSFLAVDSSLSDSFSEIITPNDIAVYGGLCALASMDRQELQKQVLDNPSFRNFLELEPHIRRAVAFFCNSKFRPCLDILENYRTDYLLDINLQRHVPALYTQIRTKAIQQYLVPFSRVTLDSMAAIFAPDVVGGEARPTELSSPFVQELIRLIKEGVLDTRIDLEKGLLVSNQTDLRTEVQTKTLDSLSSFNKEAHLRIVRAAVLHAGLEIQAGDAEQGPRQSHSSARRGPGGYRRGDGLVG